MKPAGIRYVTLLGIFLLASALAWTSLIEARGPAVSTSRLMSSARLFEQQGRSSKAVELYRRVLRAEPGHRGATVRLAIMRAKAVATFRSIEVAPQSTSKITPVEAVEPIQQTRSAEPAVVYEPVGTRLQIKSGLPVSSPSDRVAGLIPDRRKTEVTDGSDAANSAAKPKRTFQKTREALSKVGRRLGVLRSRSATTQPATKSAAGAAVLPLIPAPKPVVEPKSDVKPAESAGPTEPIVYEAVGTRLKRKTRLFGSGISEAVTGLIPARRTTKVTEASKSAAKPKRTFQKTREALSKVGRRLGVLRSRSAPTQPVTKSAAGAAASPLIPAPTPVVEPKPGVKVIRPKTLTAAEAATSEEIARTPKSIPVVVSVATAVEPESAEAVPAGNRIVAKTMSAWDKIRERFVANRESGKTPRSARTPLWTRLGESLKRTREKLAIKLGRKSTAAVEAVEVVEPKSVTGVSPEKPAAVATEPKLVVARPIEAKQPLAIPAKSVGEQITDAATALAGDSNDAAARSVLVEAVSTSPDVEASLAAYMLGTRASGHPDVMTALGQQISARTGVARVHMAEAMLRLDGNHVTATDTLVAMVSSKDMEVRMMAAFAMQSATVVQRERCISTLIKALDDSESDVRAAAALTLGAYGPSAKTALPELVRLVHDENEDTARAAGIALQCIEPPPASAQVDTRVTPVSAGADHGQ